MASRLPAVELNPSGPHTASVIWLHGLGADGHDFVPVVEAMSLPPDHGIRFIFPHAPRIPVTCNGGYVMPAWYDIHALTFGAPEDFDGYQRSADQVCEWIANECALGVPCRRIVVAGFSQGGVIALHTATRFPSRLAGVLALSTYLGSAERLSEMAAAENRDVPIFMAHGSVDGVVPLAMGIASRDMLLQCGYAVDWREYPMEHSVHPAEIADMAEFLLRVLA